MTLTRLNGDFAWAAFAQTHEALPEFPVLCPAAVTLALPSMTPVTDGLDDAAPVLALRPAVVPMAFLQADSWLTLVLVPRVKEALAVPVSLAVIPVLKKAHQSAMALGDKQALDKTPRMQSPKRIFGNS